MHVIPPFKPSVTLFHVNGGRWVYKDVAHARDALGVHWIRANVAAEFRAFSHFSYSPYSKGDLASAIRSSVYDTASFVMRDSRGKTLTAADFRLDKPYRSPFWRHLETYPGWGPVPRTGRRSSSRYYRRPGTQAERRMAQVVDPSEPAPRPSRNANALPNAWDDYGRASADDRNWKRFRKTQWKPKG